jgi:hypothetical protein
MIYGYFYRDASTVLDEQALEESAKPLKTSDLAVGLCYN